MDEDRRADLVTQYGNEAGAMFDNFVSCCKSLAYTSPTVSELRKALQNCWPKPQLDVECVVKRDKDDPTRLIVEINGIRTISAEDLRRRLGD